GIIVHPTRREMGSAVDSNLFSLLLVFGTFISVSLAAYSLKRRPAPGSLQMAWLMVATAVWCFTSIFEARGSTLDQKVFWSVVSYLGSQTTPVFFFLFTLHFTRKVTLPKPRLAASLFVLPAISLGMAITNHWHHLLWSSVSLEPVSGGVAGVYGHGPWFWVVVLYAYTLVFSSIVQLFRFIFSHSNLFSLQARMVFLGCLFPFVANVLYAIDTRLIGGFDPTPLSFTVSNVFLALAALRYRMLDLAPVAWEQVARSLDDGILVVDEQDRIVDWNLTFARWMQPTMDWVSRKLPSVLPEWEDFLQLTPEKKMRKEIEVHRAGTQVIEASTTPLRNRSKQLIGKVLLFHDISEQKRVQKELQDARNLADSANRSKSEFLATMSHEIRNPLHGIEGLLFLLEKTPLSPQQKDYLERIRLGMQTLGSIVNDILDISKVEAGKLELEETHFSLEEMVSGVAGLFQASAVEKGIPFHVEMQENAKGTYLGDPLRISQILNNFLSNALKFTASGNIVLGVTCTGDHKAAEGCSWLCFSVLDSGIGMNEEQKKRLFQSFSQGDVSMARKYGGTGLGLAISKSLAEKMGGAIHFSSSPGKGSVFSLQIQLKRVESTQPLLQEKTLPRTSPGLLRGKRVLLVEDDRVNREMTREVLEKLGLDVACAPDGAKAFQQVSTKDFDLVLTDIHLPDMEGSSIVAELRQHARHPTPVIAISASVSPTDRDQFLSAGVHRFLLKPLSPEKLAQVLGEVFSGNEISLFSDSEFLHNFDLKEGLKMVGGETEAYQKILGIFQESLEADLQSYSGFRAQQDFQQLAKLIHRLKGAALSMGAVSLGKLCEKVEGMIGSDDSLLREKWLGMLEQQMQRTIHALKPVGSNPSPNFHPESRQDQRHHPVSHHREQRGNQDGDVHVPPEPGNEKRETHKEKQGR
ncbi:MAG TPA: histidine kinase N-terminal 7TM domain-containing protein, partial [Thermotogota bacterium]|nr:histidine kinase N-terminal 7TM domain-containing protein [Thermotogota bacterium]